MSNFEILELKGQFGETTRDVWVRQMDAFTEDEDITLKSMYLSKLKYAIDEDTDAIFYGLKRVGDDHACAVLELTVKMPETKKSGLRLLNITLEPNLDIENRHAEHININFVINIIASCITYAFTLTFDTIPARTFKIYGRTDRMMLILESVAEMIEESKSLSRSLSTEIQGKWLLIAKNQ